MVGVGARVNQKVLVPSCQPDGHSVRMAVRGGARVAKCTKIHKQTDHTVIGAKASKAAIPKQLPRPPGTSPRGIKSTNKVRNECLGGSSRPSTEAQPSRFIKQERTQLGGDFQRRFVLRKYESPCVVGVAIP